MRHNVTNGVSESLALSQNAQMASNHHTSPLSASELQAAQLTQEFSLAQSRHCRVITKIDKLHLFFILASFKHFSTCALSWRQCIHTHSKRTHNARFSLSHTHTHTLCIAYADSGEYFFCAHVNGSVRSHCTQLTGSDKCSSSIN